MNATIMRLAAAAISLAALGFAQSSPGAPLGHGKLAFVLTTGFEDLQIANMMLKQTVLAKKSKYLDDVTVVVYGRGVQLFEKTDARPDTTAQLIRDAQAAGVRFSVCNNALHQFSIPEDKLDPKPDAVVPFGIVKVSELVSQGYQLIRY